MYFNNVLKDFLPRSEIIHLLKNIRFKLFSSPSYCDITLLFLSCYMIIKYVNWSMQYSLIFRARFHEQRFPPKSLSKLHALQSTVTIFHGIITVSQYR